MGQMNENTGLSVGRREGAVATAKSVVLVQKSPLSPEHTEPFCEPHEKMRTTLSPSNARSTCSPSRFEGFHGENFRYSTSHISEVSNHPFLGSLDSSPWGNSPSPTTCVSGLHPSLLLVPCTVPPSAQQVFRAHSRVPLQCEASELNRTVKVLALQD